MRKNATGRRFSIPNPISSAREVISIVKEMSLDDLREAALQDLRVAVVAPTAAEARRVAEDVFGPEARANVVAQASDDPWPRGADIVLVERDVRQRQGTGRETIVQFSADEPADRIRQTMMNLGRDVELSLGRRFPALRPSAAMHVVNTTSRANAQFAIASNLPALVPVVGGILAAGADTIVLTKNQLLMIYKLAAIHGRDLDDRFRIYREMMPVVGAGIFWRTVARDLAAMIPFAAGAVPKVAIAYAGTYAAGMAAHLFYTEGKRASAERMREFYRDALRDLRENPVLKSLPLNRRERSENGTDKVIDVDYRTDASTGMP